MLIWFFILDLGPRASMRDLGTGVRCGSPVMPQPTRQLWMFVGTNWFFNGHVCDTCMCGAHTCVGLGSSIRSRKEDLDLPHLCLLSSILYFEIGSLTEPGALISLAKVPGQEVLVSVGQSWLYRHASLMPGFDLGAGDLNSSPLAFTASLLPHWVVFSALQFELHAHTVSM